SSTAASSPACPTTRTTWPSSRPSPAWPAAPASASLPKGWKPPPRRARCASAAWSVRRATCSRRRSRTRRWSRASGRRRRPAECARVDRPGGPVEHRTAREDDLPERAGARRPCASIAAGAMEHDHGMAGIDLKRELKHLYAPSAKAVVEVDVPALRFLMIDGQGDPNATPAYAEAVAALFSVRFRRRLATPSLPARGEGACCACYRRTSWVCDCSASASPGTPSAPVGTVMLEP